MGRHGWEERVFSPAGVCVRPPSLKRGLGGQKQGDHRSHRPQAGPEGRSHGGAITDYPSKETVPAAADAGQHPD